MRAALSRPRPKSLDYLKEAIVSETARACVDRHRGAMRALVLTGSLARDEASFVQNGDRVTLLGDVEFLLVFDERRNRRELSFLGDLSREIEVGLSEKGIGARVALDAVRRQYLEGLSPHVFAYELKTCGNVVWGDGGILSVIPRFSPGDIPREDAWRLLANRMIELLEVHDEIPERSRRALYRVVKLYLDMATSLLLFVGQYEPTYRGRLLRLQSLTQRDMPFALSDFTERVAACTRWKLCPAGALPDDLWGWAANHCQLLWRWELRELTGLGAETSDTDLMDRWITLQPWSRRLRGWLYAWRKEGWLRGLRHGLGWAVHAWKASPRYWVYRAAAEEFFDSGAGLRSWLPVSPDVVGTRASGIARNYHAFLEGTRS